MLCEWVHRRQLSTDVAEEGLANTVCIREEGSVSAVVLTDFHIRPCFSIREANENKCVRIHHIHKHTENHTKQTVDISHHTDCHNLARQIVGIK